MGRVKNKVGASGDGDAKLAIGEKVLDDFVVKNSHDKRAGNATKGGANA